MKLTLALALAALCIATPAQTEEQPLTHNFREGRCLVEYLGGVYLNGPCSIEWRSDGAFAVESPSGVHVASVNLGFWTGIPLADIFFGNDGARIYALTVWINAEENSGCWENVEVKVCLWIDDLIELLRQSGFHPKEE